jgi:hypothetical protein
LQRAHDAGDDALDRANLHQGGTNGPMRPFSSLAVKATFPADARAGLLSLRELIFDVAGDVAVTETFKLGQPAYLAAKGCTIRLGVPKGGGFALYTRCQSSVISTFAATFAGEDEIEGNRAVLFSDPSQIDSARHGQLISHALRYHENWGPWTLIRHSRCGLPVISRIG